MNQPMTLALPSKGRLQQDCEALFDRIGMPLESAGARRYRGRLAGADDIDVTFLSAGDIPGALASGAAHLGVTGEDLLREEIADFDRRAALVAPLGFGRADVVVAVPHAWIDVWTMEDLDDVAAGFRARHGRRLRIATKYWNLTQTFFASHGIALYRVVESLGATEGAPAAGAADAIVDITTTGATLAANHLKALEDGLVLRSEAHLCLSRVAPWSSGALAAAERIAGALAAAGVRLCARPGASLANGIESFASG